MCVSGYGFDECRGRVRFEYAGKIGSTTLSPDLPKYQPLHNFILYLPLLIHYLTVTQIFQGNRRQGTISEG